MSSGLTSLDVHLRGELIGTLFPAGDNDYRFAYRPEIVEKVGAGEPLLSTSLPVRPEPFSLEASRAYIEDLLPEGRRRQKLAKELGLDPADGCGLLAEVGRDCAGAVVFLPEGALPEPTESDVPLQLTAEMLGELVSSPSSNCFAAPAFGGEARFGLPGTRDKLALTREKPGGPWGLPGSGVPSTHVIKPETGEFPDLIANEMFCMEVVRSAGLPVAPGELEEIAGQRCLVSRRFDREGLGADSVRIHQENFCQALGFPPRGEEADEDDADGPGFAESCGLLTAVGCADQVPLLFAAAFCNYALGIGDAHGRNFALLLSPGSTRLAPLYDLVSTAVYDLPTHTGMVISEDWDQTAYLLELGWISEECDFDFDAMRRLASTTAARIGEALVEVAERARGEDWHAPVIDEIVDLAEQRAMGLGFEVEY